MLNLEIQLACAMCKLGPLSDIERIPLFRNSCEYIWITFGHLHTWFVGPIPYNSTPPQGKNLEIRK
jgi:hypothetical protein